MSAIALLRDQHAELETLLARALAVPPAARLALIVAIGDRFEAHALIEERLLYTTFATGDAVKVLEDYARDHQRIRGMLAGLCEDPQRLTTDAIEALRVLVHRHEIDEEEATLFPLIERTLAPAELDQLGAELHALYAEVMQHAPWRSLDPDARRAAPL
jgi:hypothetical protein